MTQGFIPSGQHFSAMAPLGDSYDWMNTYPAGTPISFTMFDSLGRAGGTSGVKTVMTGTERSCLKKSSSATSSSKRSSIIGALAACVTIFLGVFFYLWWRRRQKDAAFIARVKVAPYSLLNSGSVAPAGPADFTRASSDSRIAILSHHSTHPQRIAQLEMGMNPNRSAQFVASRPRENNVPILQPPRPPRLPITPQERLDPFANPDVPHQPTELEVPPERRDRVLSTGDQPPEYSEDEHLPRSSQSSSPLLPLRRH